jgi:hypothetical protein
MLAGTPRWTVLLIIAVAASVCVGAVVLVTLQVTQAPAPTTSADRQALTAYTAALRGPTSEGGEIVSQEMRPSVTELRNGQVDGTTFAQRARGWQLAFQRIRIRLAGIDTPAPVAAARELFDQALQGYARAASLFIEAGAAQGAQRDALLAQAATAGTAADSLYNRAAAVVQAALRRAGLAPDPDLPDLPASA